jgi:hypothetical protein
MSRTVKGSRKRKKKPMSTATARASKAEVLVNELMEISKDVLADVPAEERERRLKEFNQYLSSLDETGAKHA